MREDEARRMVLSRCHAAATPTGASMQPRRMPQVRDFHLHALPTRSYLMSAEADSTDCVLVVRLCLSSVR